jgi:hypothetical protein
MRSWPVKFLVLFFVFNLLSINILKAQQFKNEAELRKEAERLFEEDEFTKAYSLYAQLVSNYPTDPELNYHLGVCMLYSEPNKKKCFSYLKLAANHPKDAPKDATFYLGKAYHMNYQFDEALKYYEDYKKIGSASQQKRLQVDKEITACKNGKRLLATMSELVVISKKQLNEADYFRSYDLSSIGGKLLVKPDDFKTGYDKRKKDKSVMYLPQVGDKIYYSSYGDNGDNGRDIYYRTRLSDGNFSKPQKIPGINTEYDEDYPFLHPDGKTLYFSSKGFNSMGGYDIFKSVFNDETNSWSMPVNMEFPINSPDDDYLFVTDEAGKIAYFSTGRQSPPGKIDVLKVNTERKPMAIAVLKGTVVKENASQRLDSKITVKNMDNGQIVGTYFAKDNGDYYMELPNGGKFIFTVETPNIPTQSDKVVLPIATSLSPFKQSISYDNKVLKILNYFDTPPDDLSYLKYLELIEKKAKLEVNENEVKNNPVIEAASSNTTNAVSTNNPTIVSDSGNNANNSSNNATAANTNTVTPKSNLSNDQLLNIAKEDAKEANTEAGKIKQDAWDANEIGEAKKIEADKLQKEADDAFTNANAITDDVKKKEALEKATEIKNQADNASNVASTIIDLAKKLQEDANTKQKEADLNQQYAEQLEKVTKNKKDQTAAAKLDEIQKQLEVITKEKKQSDEAFSNIKSNYDQKQTAITKAEEKSTSLKNEITEISKEISINDTEINNTKDKSIKKNLTGQNTELKTDLEKKNTELAANEKAISKLKEESNSIQSQLDIVNTIKTTDSKTAIAANNTNSANTNTTAINSNTNSNNTAPISLTAESVTAKYNDKLRPIQNPNDKNEYVNANTILNDYNKELDNLIALTRVDIKAASDNNEKQKFINEISKLEKQKGINEEKIADNNAKIKQLDGGTTVASNTNTTSANNTAINTNTPTENNTLGNNIAANNSTTSTPYTPIDLTSTNNADDNNKLIALKNQVDNTNNPAFGYNDYKNPNSLTLKKEAENKLQIANATKTDLLISITKAEESIKNNTGTPTSGPSKDKLNEEGDDLSGKAKDLRNQAQNKTGDEKQKALDDARNLDAEANKKYLEATEVTKTQNSKEFNVNNENIDNLIKTGKSASGDISEAKKLNNEANTAFKQAIAIRSEANGLGSDAAKLGTISNAEEKEAEAIAKQNKALELLLKANAGFDLKKADGAAPDNSFALNSVKQQNEKFNKDKMDAYMALSKANQNEYKTQSPKVKTTNSESANLKKQADALNKEALTLISKALTEPNAGAKQNLLLEANKKEVEALSTLNKADEASKSNAIANNNNAGNNNGNSIGNTNTAGNNTSTDNSNTTNSNTGNSTDNNTAGNKNTTANTNTTAVATNTPETNTNGNNTVNTNTTVVTTNTPETNSNGNNTANNTTTTNTVEAVSTSTYQTTPDEAKTKIDNLTVEADGFAAEASKLRKEAADKTDPEKTDLITKAKGLEARSLNTKLQASALQKDLNEAQYTNLNEAITNYLEKAKAKGGAEVANAEELISMINTNKKQANDIRNEANTSTNNNAKLGGLSNAEEKEAEIQLRQYDVINMLKKYDESYAVKTPVVNVIPLTEAKTTPTVAVNNNTGGNNNVATNNNTNPRNNTNNNTGGNNTNPRNNANNTGGNNNVAANNNTNPRNNANNNTGGNNNVAANNNTNPRNNANNNTGGNNTTPRNNVNNNTGGNNTTPRNNVNTNTAANNNTPNVNAVPFKAAGIEVKTTNVYSGNNPIPVDQKIPTGLVFRVQIGAFKAPVPNNSFGGLTPVNGETTPNGYIRYTAGNFEKFEDANAVKNDLRNLGYQDAFVVGFYEGRRISINEAITILQKDGKEVNLAPNTSAGISANNNIPKNTAVTPVNTNPLTTNTEPAVITKELEQINGLLFTVQIGVYSRQVTRGQLYNLSPIFTEKLPSGLYRYTAGIYNVKDHLSTDRARVNGIGIKDAFSSAYYNGKRITFTQAEQIKNDSVNLKMETENPIVFPAGGEIAPATNNATGGVTPAVTPFTNGVTTGPVPTAENGVKVGEEGLSFRVQIGAYKNQVPAEIAANFQKIKEWPVDNKLINALYIYTVGNFTDVKFAKQLKDQMIGLGIGDAFVSVYQNGKKLTYAESQQYLNR